MIHSSGAADWRTSEAMRLAATGLFLTALITIALAAGVTSGNGQFVVVAASVAVFAGVFAVLRPASVGLPLMVVVIFANASDILTRLFSVPSILQGLFALMVAAIFLWRDQLPIRQIVTAPLTLVFSLYLVLVFVSSTWAPDPRLTDARLAELIRGLLLFVLVALFAATSWKALRTAVTALVLTAAVLSSLSLYQVVTGNYHQQFGRFAAVEFGHLYARVSEARIAGPVADPNFYAQLLLIAIPLGLCLTATTRGVWQKAGYGALTLLVICATLLTYSRGAMLALVAILILIPFVLPVRRYAVAGGLVVLLLLLPLAPTELGRRLATIEKPFSSRNNVERDSSFEKRRLLIRTAWAMFEDRPLLGIGSGNFNTLYPRYASQIGFASPHYDDPGGMQFPHSLLLEVAAENGLAGLGLFGALLSIAFAATTQGRRKLQQAGRGRASLLVAALGLGLAGYLVAAVFLHGAYLRYLWLLLGLILAAALLSSSGDDTHAAGAV